MSRESLQAHIEQAANNLEAVSRRAARGEVGEVTLQIARQRLLEAKVALSHYETDQNCTGNLVKQLLHSSPEPEPWLVSLVNSKGGVK